MSQDSPRSYMDGKRDLRLDFLRGYALFAMTLTHLGLASPLIVIAGGSRFLFNAAEVFFFISGLTIGYIALGRPLSKQVASRFSRVWVIYRYVLLFSFGLTVLFEAGMFAELTRGQSFLWIVEIVTMRESVYGMDVLIPYVFYVAFAPLVLWAMNRGRTRAILITLTIVYVVSVMAPDATALGFASFRHLGANSLIFFGALVLGYHRHELYAWWNQFRWRRVVDAVIIVAGIGLLVAFLTDYGGNEAIESFFGDIEIREFRMPPQNLLVVFVYLRILWLMATHLWKALKFLFGWFALPLGRDSLFTYCMHITLIEVFYLFDLGISDESHFLLRFLGEFIVVGALLGSVLLRRGIVRFLYRREWLERTNRRLVNAFLSVSLVGIFVLILTSAQPGWALEEFNDCPIGEDEEHEDEEYEDEEYEDEEYDDEEYEDEEGEDEEHEDEEYEDEEHEDEEYEDEECEFEDNEE